MPAPGSRPPRAAARAAGEPVAGGGARPGVLAVAAPEPEYREQERREEDLKADNHQGGRQHGQSLLGQVAEAALRPADDDHGDEREPGHEDRATGQKPVLETEARPHSLEPWVAV